MRNPRPRHDTKFDVQEDYFSSATKPRRMRDLLADAVKAMGLLADLYDAWHAAEPDGGYDAKAVQWRAKLSAPVDEERRAASPASAD